MNRDPDIYGADAHEFNPSRHLDSEGKIKAALVDTKEECHSKLLGLLLRGDKFTDCGFSDLRVRSSNLPWPVWPTPLHAKIIFSDLITDISQITRCLLTLQLSCGPLQ
jgi:hypothetical protein